jgi:hypothetical protein
VHRISCRNQLTRLGLTKMEAYTIMSIAIQRADGGCPDKPASCLLIKLLGHVNSIGQSALPMDELCSDDDILMRWCRVPGSVIRQSSLTT